VVEISVGWVGELKSSHADVVESFVINTEGLIGVLNQLMNGESSIVWLDNGVGDLGGWDNGKGGHHAVGELLANLGDQKRPHTGTSSTTKRVGDLETLKAVTALSLTTNNIQNLIDKLSTLSVMSLRPVVTSTRLAEDEVVGAEELTERTSTDSIHSTWLQIDEDGARNILVTGSLARVNCDLAIVCFDAYLVEVDVHALELEVRGTIVAKGDVSEMLTRSLRGNPRCLKTLTLQSHQGHARQRLFACVFISIGGLGVAFGDQGVGNDEVVHTTCTTS
jgi:hypothetical protein